jgi:hypothetical protein
MRSLRSKRVMVLTNEGDVVVVVEVLVMINSRFHQEWELL